MKFLITGITGFVGASLAQRLFDDGHEAHALIRSSNGREADILDVVSSECFNAIKFHYGDLMDKDSLRNIFHSCVAGEEFDGVFHLAAQSHPPTGFLDPIGTLQTNLIGSANLFAACPKETKICVVSTSEVYGNSGSDGRLLKESDSLAPSNPYATGKAAMDLHFQERMKNGYDTGFITRAFSHTGPRRGKTFSISSDAYQLAQFIIDAKSKSNISDDDLEEMSYNERKSRIEILSGNKPHKLKVGNLDTIRCVADVDDVVEAYVQLMYHPDSNGGIFNVCGGTPKRMGYFTDKLIELSKLNVEKVVDEKLYRPIDIQYQAGDTTTIKKLIGWEPVTPIEETLERLLHYWIKKLS